MAKGRFLVENFFNERIFSGHTLTANESASGSEPWRVGTGRRSSRNYWTPTTSNAAAWLKVECDRTRAADMIAIDRVHNLGGHTVRVQVSDDDSTYRDAAVIVVPSNIYPGTRLSAGARTEEGAVLRTFDLEVGKYWRVYIDAMGSGLRPQIGGIHLGLSWEPSYHFELPYDDESADVIYDEVLSDTAWAAATTPAFRRAGELRLKLGSPAEHDLARYHLTGLYARRRPMWIVGDQDRAERALLAVVPSGRTGFPLEAGWSNRRTSIAYVEHEPRLGTY